MKNCNRVFVFFIGTLLWAYVIAPGLGLTGAANMLLSICFGYALMSWVIWGWK